jgi:hypothetical protein
MRASCQRHRQGIRVVLVELREPEIDALVTCHLLRPAQRNHKDSVGGAFGKLLDKLPPPSQWPELLALCELLKQMPSRRWRELLATIEERFAISVPRRGLP